MKLHDSREVSAPKMPCLDFFLQKNIPSGRGIRRRGQILPVATGKRSRLHLGAFLPQRSSGIWIWSVDLGDDRAQDHVWIPNCPCRFELKKGVKKSGKYHFRDLCVSVRVSCISWCFGLKLLIFYEEGSKDPEVGSADLWKPSKREGHSRSLSSSDTSRSKRFKEQMEKLETQQKKASLKTSSVTTK